MSENILYAQSGGVTAVINATACGLIQAARATPGCGMVLAARNGIIGVLREELIDTSTESDETIADLRHTPGGAFGSCRYKLADPAIDDCDYRRLLEVFRAHEIGYFFYNGGNDSQDTTSKLAGYCQSQGYPVRCIGIPKTVDNDLVGTDFCPGFGSVAKYVAVSVREAGLDVASMCASSTRVFVLEVMGRHTGWIAAAAGLASEREGDPPHLILMPERVFDRDAFLAAVQQAVTRWGYAVIVASEGVRAPDGDFLSNTGSADAFGHRQLGGVAPLLAEMVREHLGFKYHWAVADYLQRSARHIASATDVEQAWDLGQHALSLALEGVSDVMVALERTENGWDIATVPLGTVANRERRLPPEYIDESGFGITEAAREYLLPLVKGEAYPPYRDGLPDYARLRAELVKPKLPPYQNG